MAAIVEFVMIAAGTASIISYFRKNCILSQVDIKQYLLAYVPASTAPRMTTHLEIATMVH